MPGEDITRPAGVEADDPSTTGIMIGSVLIIFGAAISVTCLPAGLAMVGLGCLLGGSGVGYKIYEHISGKRRREEEAAMRLAWANSTCDVRHSLIAASGIAGDQLIDNKNVSKASDAPSVFEVPSDPLNLLGPVEQSAIAIRRRERSFRPT